MVKLPTNAVVLVTTTNTIATDPVVLKEIAWLKRAGCTVITLAPGEPFDADTQHITLHKRPLPQVWLSRLAMPSPKKRWQFVYGHILDDPVVQQVLPTVDLVLNNDLDLLPGLVAYKDQGASKDSRNDASGNANHYKIHQHLYELFHSSWPGWRWRLFRKKFQQYLNTFIGDQRVDSWSTIGPSAALDYEENFAGLKMQYFMNTEKYLDIHLRPTDPQQIDLVYVGAAGPDRGLENLVAAVPLFESRFRLNFLVNGLPSYVAMLKDYAGKSNGRIRVHPAVALDHVAKALSAFDLSLIFFPPVNKNIEHTLGNKFFQSIQARLALVIGESPGMQSLVEHYKNGVVVHGWSAEDLARSLNGLSAQQIDLMKNKSAVAAKELSTEEQFHHFVKVVLKTTS